MTCDAGILDPIMEKERSFLLASAVWKKQFVE